MTKDQMLIVAHGEHAVVDIQIMQEFTHPNVVEILKDTWVRPIISAGKGAISARYIVDMADFGQPIDFYYVMKRDWSVEVTKFIKFDNVELSNGYFCQYIEFLHPIIRQDSDERFVGLILSDDYAPA